MTRSLLTGLALFAALAAANAQYNEPIPPSSTEAGSPPIPSVINLAGIAAVINTEKETGRILITGVLPNGPAEKAGLKAKDYLDKIDDKPTKDLDLPAVVALLRGDPGTTVKVTITRSGQSAPSEFVVTREIVRLP